MRALTGALARNNIKGKKEMVADRPQESSMLSTTNFLFSFFLMLLNLSFRSFSVSFTVKILLFMIKRLYMNSYNDVVKANKVNGNYSTLANNRTCR